MRDLTDRAVGLRARVASKSDNEGRRRRATKLCIMCQGGRWHGRVGDSRDAAGDARGRLLRRAMVSDHRVSAHDQFRLEENSDEARDHGDLLSEPRRLTRLANGSRSVGCRKGRSYLSLWER